MPVSGVLGNIPTKGASQSPRGATYPASGSAMPNLRPRVWPKVRRTHHGGYTFATQKLSSNHSDTLRRHIQIVHGVAEPASQIKPACTRCRDQKIRCYGGPPCANCERRGVDCSLSLARRDEITHLDPTFSAATGTPSTIPQSIPQKPRLRRTEIEDRFVGIYFDMFHPHWPFIHRGTFVEFETPLLVQSMVAIGLWMSGGEKEKSKAIDLHNLLGKAVREQTVCQ